MAEPSDDNILAWLRQTLTGDPDSATPTSSQVRLVIPTAKAQLASSYPCTSSITSENDVLAFEEAAGMLAASLYIQTPAGRSYAGNVVQTKVGPVTRTQQEVGTGEAVTFISREMKRALGRIGCIRDNMVVAPLADLVGRRRTIGESPTIQGEELGLGSSYRREVF